MLVIYILLYFAFTLKNFFQQGLMTFEDEKLESAINSLKATQKLCNASEDDLIDNLKNKFRKKVS